MQFFFRKFSRIKGASCTVQLRKPGVEVAPYRISWIKIVGKHSVPHRPEKKEFRTKINFDPWQKLCMASNQISGYIWKSIIRGFLVLAGVTLLSNFTTENLWKYIYSAFSNVTRVFRWNLCLRTTYALLVRWKTLTIFFNHW